MGKLPVRAKLTHEWFEAYFINQITLFSFRSLMSDGSKISFEQSQGLCLWCPCGFGQLDSDGNERFPTDLSLGRGRPHGLIIPFRNPPCGIAFPEDFGPLSRDGKSHPRWLVGGTGLHDLTLDPSIAVGNPECWHGFIKDGEVT